MALMLWFGFLGSWLLVAGPLFQGVLEVRDQEIDQEEVRAAIAGIEPGPRPSRWWWLIPPLMFAKSRRRSEAYWQEALAILPANQAALIAGLRPKMYGWFIVSLGASFLAMKETWELAEHYEWSTWVYVGVVVMLGLLAIVNASVGGARRSERDRLPRTQASAPTPIADQP